MRRHMTEDPNWRQWKFVLISQKKSKQLIFITFSKDNQLSNPVIRIAIWPFVYLAIILCKTYNKNLSREETL